MSAYACQTCGETVRNVAAARKHAKQGYKTQREAFAAGELHSLHLVTAAPACGCDPDTGKPCFACWSSRHGAGSGAA